MADQSHDLGKFARNQLAQAILGTPQLLALLASVAEAAGLEIPEEPGPDFQLGLEIDAARVVVRRGPAAAPPNRAERRRAARQPKAAPAP